MRQNLQRTRRFQQWEERREQSPHQVCGRAEQIPGFQAAVLFGSGGEPTHRRTSRAWAKSSGYSLVISIQRPSPGWAKANDLACSH
ncbi:Uncharacterised protein [Mycobacteroides abscessus subsp. abscessus]|nr:Uncharacterised protein [Mycobacteroides abscessus subsp. abscessus]